MHNDQDSSLLYFPSKQLREINPKDLQPETIIFIICISKLFLTTKYAFHFVTIMFTY